MVLKLHLKRNVHYKLQISDLLFLSINCFLYYTIWFQYAFSEIPYLISLLGIIMAACTAAEAFCGRIRCHAALLGTYIFFLYTLLCGVFVSPYLEKMEKLVLHNFKYMIPMAAITAYVNFDRTRLNKIFQSISVSVALMAISNIFTGNITNNGGVALGDLNTNVQASVLILGTYTTLMLLQQTKRKWEKVFWGIVLILELAVQVKSASRRGTVVHIFFLALFFLALFIREREYTKLFNHIIVIGMGLFALPFLLGFFGDRIKKLAVFRRLSIGIGMSRGDHLRKYYQSVALQLFKESPILGQGLGAVEGACGVYSHSMYYEVLSCTGIIGFVIILFITAGFLKNVWPDRRSLRNDTENEIMQSIITVFYTVSLLISGVAVVYIYDNFFYIIVGMFAAIVNVTKQRNRIRK